MSGNALEVLNAVRTADLLLQRRPVGEGADQVDPKLRSSENEDSHTRLLLVPARPWTTLANDDVVSDLITSFFLLDATFFLAFVEQEAFLEDMRSCSPKTARYCSPVLVNAICALRCVRFGASVQSIKKIPSGSGF